MNCLKGITIILVVAELIITLLKENALGVMLFVKQLTKSIDCEQVGGTLEG